MFGRLVIGILVIILHVSSIDYIFSHQTRTTKQIAVNITDVIIKDNEMRCKTCSGQEFPITSLQIINGTYFATPKIDNLFGAWWCYNCQRWNSKFTNVCWYCGADKPDDDDD